MIEINETRIVVGVDTAYYRATYPDLAKFDDEALRVHYERHGREEGRLPRAGAARESFLQMIPREGLALEIGPFSRPALTGDHVRYADAMSAETIKAIAAEHGMDPALCPTIHYLITETPLSTIAERFATVFSSHCIEHQPDLVEHLQTVDRLLEPGGSYFLIVPDKRYCFDHFRPESTVADVIAAHAERRTNHDLKSFVNHIAMMAHNDHFRHWTGDHGAPAYVSEPDCLDNAVKSYLEAAGHYVDAHAWQFTPQSFDGICSLLHQRGYVPLKPVAIYPTLLNRNEFCAVLSR